MLRTVAFLTMAGSAALLSAQYAPANAKWNQAIEPVRIVGNLYYVGASDVSAFLIATPQGHILIDTGFRETVPMIESNLEKLGFHLKDIRILLAFHAHYDHAGGLAEIKSRTGARFLASAADAPLFSRGGTDDFAFGDAYPFPPVKPDGELKDGEPISLGGVTLTTHLTPGHTKGCTSWSTTIKDGEHSYRVVLAGSLSAPDYRLVGNSKYPEIVEDYRASFAKLHALPCDVFVSQHSWDFDLHGKIQRRAEDPSRNPFVDPNGYRQYVDKAQAALDKRLREQQAK